MICVMAVFPQDELEASYVLDVVQALDTNLFEIVYFDPCEWRAFPQLEEYSRVGFSASLFMGYAESLHNYLRERPVDVLVSAGGDGLLLVEQIVGGTPTVVIDVPIDVDFKRFNGRQDHFSRKLRSSRTMEFADVVLTSEEGAGLLKNEGIRASPVPRIFEPTFVAKKPDKEEPVVVSSPRYDAFQLSRELVRRYETQVLFVEEAAVLRRDSSVLSTIVSASCVVVPFDTDLREYLQYGCNVVSVAEFPSEVPYIRLSKDDDPVKIIAETLQWSTEVTDEQFAQRRKEVLDYMCKYRAENLHVSYEKQFKEAITGAMIRGRHRGW